MAQKKTQAQFEAEVIALYGTKYDLSKVVYVGTHTAVEVVCPEHGSFFPTPKNLLNGKACRACGLKAGGQGRTNKLRIEFETKAIDLGYTPQPTETWNSRVRVPLVCPKHGDFTCYPHTALHKNSWCPACGKERTQVANRNRILPDLVKRLATTAPTLKVTAVVLEGTSTTKHARATISCPTHGEYTTSAESLRQGTACPQCANARRGQYQIKSEATRMDEVLAVHGTRYTYPDGVPQKRLDYVTICCSSHGVFSQRLAEHLSGKGCKKCTHQISNAERWACTLLEHHTSVETQVHIGGKEVDIYLPEHKLAIELNGELFHADTNPYSPTPNPKGKTKHREKEDACAAAGVRLIQIWGSQWENRRPVIERLLLSAIGKDPAPLVGGRECIIDPEVPFREAMEFYEANHPQGKGTSNAKNWGLRYKKTGQLVACMSFSTTADRRGAAATSWSGASLTRYATSHRVPGGASKLLNAWRKANPGVAVMSYSDPMLFAGKTYATLGFTAVKRLDPDYLVFVTKERKLYHKSAFQRKNLEKWRVALKCDDVVVFDPATDTRTEFQMEDAMGVKRVWNTGLIRWELPPV